MENLFKILKQLMGTAGMLGNIPKPIRVAMLYMGAFVGVLVIFKYAHLGQSEKTFLIIAAVVLAIITGIYFAWKGWTQKQQKQQFGGDISQHSAATPRGVSDPGQRARLDDMRKKFQSGVEAYKSRGKDLYKLPWYVIVGEPGSGKTEAVRHSNVGFPPGMQDEFQGVGGTINMNWWFTNHAVLLDTAGRLMFEEVKPGETSEWKEFLNLLKKNRPNCPINGLFLVIPSDSLIKDSADAIQKKAGKIAQQLDVIQRVLDVRFPVFVVVTKCDKINGFREFFDGLTDPQLQHQMMGWSNPLPLDEPFKPELVEKHLEQVGARLRRRRLGLMRDPVPENPDGRRTDEVDSLYALPHSLELLSSRLRRYLETIFIAGEWSAKPLFLRGIYFSSSMREGSALDAELADVLGVGVEELPEGKVWERERAYFLRDLFLEKVFREKGLVTRASNTRHMLRGQQIALYGFGFAALAVFSAVAWFAMSNLRNGVKDQGDHWQVVSAAGWDNKYWKQSIVPIRGDGSFASTIFTGPIMVDNKPMTLGEFHVKLRDLAEKPLKRNFMFPGLAAKYNQNSRTAQRIVFEAGVVRPLIEATRQKMSHDEPNPASAQYQPDALAELIQLEADILSRGTGTNTGELGPERARRFFGAFQNYVAGTNAPMDTNLVAVMSWTYSTNATAKGSWAPRWLSGRRGGPSTLAANAGIKDGIELFARGATNSIQTYISDLTNISSLHASAKAFADAERALFTAAEGGLDDKFVKAEQAVEAARKNLDEEVKRHSTQPLFAGGVSLTNAQQRFRAGVTRSAGGAIGRVRELNDAALAANKDVPLFKDIKARLDEIQASLDNRVAKLIESNDLKEFQMLDETYLTDASFMKRTDLYSKAEKLIAQTPFPGGPLVGYKGDQLKTFSDEISAAGAEAAKSSGKVAAEFNKAIAYELKRAERAFFKTYLAEAKKKLADNGGFPLVKNQGRIMTVDQFKEASKQLQYISGDLGSPTFQKPGLRDDPEWKLFTASVAGQQAVAQSLTGDAGCSLSLARIEDPPNPKDDWRAHFRFIKLAFPGDSNKKERSEDSNDIVLDGRVPVEQKFAIQLSQQANTPAKSKDTDAWGVVWLIHKWGRAPSKADLTSWLVDWPVDEPGYQGMIRLKLKFDRPLPELENWPAL